MRHTLFPLIIFFIMSAVACIRLSAQKQVTADSLMLHLPDSSNINITFFDTLRLDEVTVTASIPPIEQKGDTVIFNPNAYKVPEDAYLEALVRRIPGLNYDSKNHTISFNGYTIKEITVNGKEFFKGNNRIALENIPASFVNKLRVYDKESDEEQATGIRNTEKNYILDLQTKKNVNGTLNASAEAGYGTHKKKNLSGQVFQFEEGGDNFSIVGKSGNRDFTTPDERNVSHSIGTNFTRHIRENVELSASTSFSYNRDGSTSSGYNENYLTQTTQYGVNTNNSQDKSRNLQGNIHVKWKIDDNTTLSIRGNAGYMPSESLNDTRSATFSANPELDLKNPFAQMENIDRSSFINEYIQQAQYERETWKYNIQTLLSRKIGRKGNNLTLAYNTSRNHSNNKSFKLNSATYFRFQDAMGNDSVSNQNQYQTSPYTALKHEMKVAYTHTLSRYSKLQIAYSFSRSHEDNRQSTYDLSRFQSEEHLMYNLPQDYESGRIDSLSNNSKSTTIEHRIMLTYSYQGKMWNIRGSMQFYPQQRTLEQTDNRTEIDTSTCNVEWSPSLVLTYNKKNWYAMFNYNGYTTQPSLRSLLAPTEYVSPLYIVRSNPNLRPSYNHNIYFIMNNFTKGLNASVSFSQEFNSVTQSTTYDPESGKRETIPTNIDGNWNLTGNAGYNKSIGLFRMFANASGSHSHRTSMIDDGETEQMTRSLTKVTEMGADLQISYVPVWGNIDLNWKWNHQQSKNSLQGNNTYSRYYMIGITANVQLPFNIRIDTDANYHIRNGTGINGNDNNEILWNIRLAWKFLKEKRAELSLYWADILNQKKSYYRYASATRFSEIYSEQLRGYFMVSMKYQFNKIN